MPIKFIPLPTETVRAFQNGEADSYGNIPEQRVSDGDGIPCRHCLKNIPFGETYLVLAYRPFNTLQAYAETGPIFLCAKQCGRAKITNKLPKILDSTNYIIRGYDNQDCIVYGTGSVVPVGDISTKSTGVFDDERVTYVHVRSAQNNCFQCRIEADT